MAEMKRSGLVIMLFDRAQKIEKPSAIVTAERFIVALIDAHLSKAPYGAFGELPGAMKVLEKTGMTPEFLRCLLIGVINEERSTLLLDDIYMRKKLMIAEKRAKEQNLTEITAGLLVECIMDDPSVHIRKILSSSETSVSSKPTNPIKPPKPPRPVKVNPIITEDDIFFEVDTNGDKDKNADEPVNNLPQSLSELTENTKNIHAALTKTVFGQDNAIAVFTSGYFRAQFVSMTDKDRKRPCATYLFAGPPGVGKTFLAETIANELKLPFMRLDMSEYADKEALIEFCGSDKVYKNGKAGNFTSFVEGNPQSVILFDEIEKAHISVIHLFLQILDAGRIRDNYTDREISLKNAIMIFTTNAGKQLYNESDSGDFSSLSRKVILKALEKDINPETGNPYFPAAICSRFASGNVVMFNHMSAHNLRNIAKKEVLRQTRNLEASTGIKTQIDKNVFTALLLAEGGSVDARTIKSRAESFFNEELFELMRLTNSDKSKTKIEKIENIKLVARIPAENKEIAELFAPQTRPQALVFASDSAHRLFKEGTARCETICVSDVKDAEKALRENDIKFVLVDIKFNYFSGQTYLNAEDEDSPARDFLHYLRKEDPSLPVYITLSGGTTLTAEERSSFKTQGVRDIIEIADKTDVEENLGKICETIHQQSSIATLAKANKLVKFETAQRFELGGKTAVIELFDFSLDVAIDAEDAQNVLSGASVPDVSFGDVVGSKDAIEELKYFASYLKNPKKYMGTGVSAPKGVLLYGPPGTGKTMLAKAMANEAGVTFIAAEGNQFLKRYAGEGPEAVHEIFRTARKYAPSILFVDEIDSIAKERTGDDQSGADDILTAFLAEMDGFKNTPSKPVFVLAATNYEVEEGSKKSLDPALMRRFDRRVFIDLPGLDGRIEFMRKRIKNKPIFDISEEKIKNLAVRSTGMSLAKLSSVFEMALRTAVRNGTKVTDAVLDEAFETFNSGEKKEWDDTLLLRVARHEAGHAFLCWQSGEVPSYVTVVARANHGGYMQHGDNEKKALYTKAELLANIRTALGGRAAETVCYGPHEGLSTGAGGDLISATKMAEQIVCSYGMDETIGLAVVDSRSMGFGSLADDVRRAVNTVLLQEMENAKRLITENRTAFDRLVNELILRNHLSGTQIDCILKGGSID